MGAVRGRYRYALCLPRRGIPRWRVRTYGKSPEILRFKLNAKTKTKGWDALVAHMNLPYEEIGWEFCPEPSRFKDKVDVEKLWAQINNENRITGRRSSELPCRL